MKIRKTFGIKFLLWLHVLFVVVFAGWYYWPRPPLVVYRLNNGRVVLEEDPRKQFASFGLTWETTDRSLEDLDAWEKLQTGVTHWRSLKKSSAIALWKSVVEDYSGSEPAFASLVNVGHGLRELGKTRDAIEAYRSAIDSEVQEDFTKHYVCINLSHAYFEIQDLASAIRYARLARTKYHADTFCGTCSQWDDERIDHYISQIQLAIDERRPARLENTAEWDARY